GSTGGLICLSLRGSEWPSLKTATPAPKWRIGSIPSNPLVELAFASMHEDGHQRLLLHIKSDLGMASPMRRFSAGLRIELRLNQGRVRKLTPATVKSSPG